MLKKDFLLHQTYLYKTLQILTYVFDWLYFTQCLTSFSSIEHLLRLFAHLLMFPSANVFVFGDFNVHHKGWLTYSDGTDQSGELCYNFSISNDLTQIVNLPAWIPDCDSHSTALLDLFLFPDASICSAMAYPPLGTFDHVVSVSIDFLLNSQRDAPFHHIAYDYSRADWNGLCDHLRDVSWEDIFKLIASAVVSEF